MPLWWHQMTMKKLYIDQFPPLEKGVRGDLGFLLLRHCEERSDVAISSTQSVIMRSVLCDVRISSFSIPQFHDSSIPQHIKDEILAPSKSEGSGCSLY